MKNIYHSSDVKNLCGLISAIVEDQTQCETYTVKCILVNTPPGTGKTWAINGIVHESLIDDIVFVDVSVIEPKCLKLVELYQSMLGIYGKSRSKLMVLDGISSSRRRIHQDLRRVMESGGLEAPCILLLLSSTFDTTDSRIHRLEFHNYGYFDVVGYLKYKNRAYQGSKLGIPDAELSQLLSTLNPRIQVTCGTLARVFEHELYHFGNTVAQLNIIQPPKISVTSCGITLEFEPSDTVNTEVVEEDEPPVPRKYHVTSQFLHCIGLDDTVSIHLHPHSALYGVKLELISDLAYPVGTGTCMIRQFFEYSKHVYYQVVGSESPESIGVDSCANQSHYRYGEYTLCVTCVGNLLYDIVGHKFCAAREYLRVKRKTENTIPILGDKLCLRPTTTNINHRDMCQPCFDLLEKNKTDNMCRRKACSEIGVTEYTFDDGKKLVRCLGCANYIENVCRFAPSLYDGEHVCGTVTSKGASIYTNYFCPRHVLMLSGQESFVPDSDVEYKIYPRPVLSESDQRIVTDVMKRIIEMLAKQEKERKRAYQLYSTLKSITDNIPPAVLEVDRNIREVIRCLYDDVAVANERITFAALRQRVHRLEVAGYFD